MPINLRVSNLGNLAKLKVKVLRWSKSQRQKTEERKSEKDSFIANETLHLDINRVDAK